MGLNRTPWSIDDLCAILRWSANAFLALGAVLVSFHLLAPFFGGGFLVKGLLIYGSWVVFALCWKCECKGIGLRKFDRRRFVLFTVIEALCLVWWFPVPYNLVVALVFYAVKFAGWKSLLKRAGL